MLKTLAKKKQSLPIAASLIISTALTLLVGLTLSGWYSYTTSKQLLMDSAVLTLKETMSRQSGRLRDSIHAVTKDALLIAELEGIEAVISPAALEGIATRNEELARIETAFGLMLKTKDYLQIRLISADSGREVVRVERHGADIQVVSAENLQFKAGKDYFVRAREFAKHTVYVSGISLNKERGIIQTPWVPTQYFSVPLYKKRQNAEGLTEDEIYGVLVINTDAERLMGQLDDGQLFDMVLVNSNGDTLYHVDSTLRWGFEFDVSNGYRFQRERAWEELKNGTSDVFYDTDLALVSVLEKVPLMIGLDDFLGVIMEVKISVIEGKADILRHRLQWISLIVVLLSIVLSAVIVRRLTRPLAKLTFQLKSILNGSDENISVVGSKEISLLSDVFVALLEKLRKRHEDEIRHTEKVEAMNLSLEDKVRIRTLEITRSSHDEKFITDLLSKALEHSLQLEYLKDTLFYLFDNVEWLSPCEQSFFYLESNLSKGFSLSMITDDSMDCVRMPVILLGENDWVKEIVKIRSSYYSNKIPCVVNEIHQDNTFGGYIVPVCQDDEMIGFLCLVMPEEIENDGKSLLLLDRVAKVLRVGVTKRLNDESLLNAKLDAEKASKVKSEFLSVMSHEMRTPMNAIVGFVTRILKNSENLTARQLDALEMVSSSSNGLLTIIDDILDFSKMDSCNMQLVSAPFLVTDMLNSLTLNFSGAAKDKGLDFQLELKMDVGIKVHGDVVRISKVLNNLLSNAIKFTDVGKVVLFAMAERVTSKEGDIGSFTFGVRDSGVGIAAEKIGEIFKPFTQMESFITRQHGGTGLGLAICQKSVELMGGKIWVESGAGKGATFCFWLTLPIYDD